MSADGHFPADSDAVLLDALMSALRADDGVRAVFGTPARIFDDESEAPVFPFAVLERHDVTPAGSSLVAGAEHRFTLATASRHGGRALAREAVGALRNGADRFAPNLPGQRVVLAQTVYSDVVRTPDRRRFRGLVRIRIITEETE